MKYIRVPEYLSGQVCGIVVFMPETQCHQPMDRIHLTHSIMKAVNYKLAENCSAFLIPLCDAYNIYVARVLLHMRKRYKNIRLFTVAPAKESVLGSSLTMRVAVERVEMLADHFIHVDTLIEDFPIQVAMRSDQLVVYTTKGNDRFDDFECDLQYIACTCSMEILFENS